MSISRETSEATCSTTKRGSQSFCFGSVEDVRGDMMLTLIYDLMQPFGWMARRCRSSLIPGRFPTNAYWRGTRFTLGMTSMSSGSLPQRRGWKDSGIGPGSSKTRPCSQPSTSACRSGSIPRVLEYLLYMVVEMVQGACEDRQQPLAATDHYPRCQPNQIYTVEEESTLLIVAARQELLRLSTLAFAAWKDVSTFFPNSSWKLKKGKSSSALLKQPSPQAKAGRGPHTTPWSRISKSRTLPSTRTGVPHAPVTRAATAASLTGRAIRVSRPFTFLFPFPTQSCLGIASATASTASRERLLSTQRRMLSSFFETKHTLLSPSKRTRARKLPSGEHYSGVVRPLRCIVPSTSIHFRKVLR